MQIFQSNLSLCTPTNSFSVCFCLSLSLFLFLFPAISFCIYLHIANKLSYIKILKEYFSGYILQCLHLLFVPRSPNIQFLAPFCCLFQRQSADMLFCRFIVSARHSCFLTQVIQRVNCLHRLYKKDRKTLRVQSIIFNDGVKSGTIRLKSQIASNVESKTLKFQ